MMGSNFVTIRRRSLLVGGAGLLLTSKSTLAAQEKVWRSLSQQELDAAYDQAVWAPDLGRFVKRFATASERTRTRLGRPRRLSYGEADTEGVDFFNCGLKSAPVMVFIHGGAWRLGKAEENAFIAESLTRAGAHVLIPDFPWVQDVGKSLYPIVNQLRGFMKWLFQKAPDMAIDRNRIFLGGHSSGAHLASVLLTTDWQALGLPKTLIKGGLCSSGMFDLEPVSLSARRNYIDFTPAMVADLSPVRHLDHLQCPLVVTYGSLESPEFVRQSQDFSRDLTHNNKPHRLLMAEGYNHFEVMETLANPYGELGAATLELMGLGPG